jgi:hypothetical protein
MQMRFTLVMLAPLALMLLAVAGAHAAALKPTDTSAHFDRAARNPAA